MTASLEELEAELARQDEELEDTIAAIARTAEGRRIAPQLEGLRLAPPAAPAAPPAMSIPLTAVRA